MSSIPPSAAHELDQRYDGRGQALIDRITSNPPIPLCANISVNRATAVKTVEMVSKSAGPLPARKRDEHIKAIYSALETKRYDVLSKLLSRSMQCARGVRDVTPGYDGAGGSYAMMFHVDACPFVEALLRVDTKAFLDLMQRFAAMEDPEAYKALVGGLKDTSLRESDLFSFDRATRDKFIAAVNELESYAEELRKQDEARGAAAQALAEDLVAHTFLLVMQSYKVGHSTMLEDSPEHVVNMQTLQFKFNVLNTLHTADAALSTRPGYANIVWNILSIVCSGGLLNLINYCVTGHFFFGSRTQAQRLVERVEDAIKFDGVRFTHKARPQAAVAPVPPPVVPDVDLGGLNA